MSGLELRAIPLLLVVSTKVATLLEKFTVLSTSKDLAPKATCEPGRVTILRAPFQEPAFLVPPLICGQWSFYMVDHGDMTAGP